MTDIADGMGGLAGDKLELGRAFKAVLSSNAATSQDMRNLTDAIRASHEMYSRFMQRTSRSTSAKANRPAGEKATAQAAGPTNPLTGMFSSFSAAGVNSTIPQAEGQHGVSVASRIAEAARSWTAPGGSGAAGSGGGGGNGGGGTSAGASDGPSGKSGKGKSFAEGMIAGGAGEAALNSIQKHRGAPINGLPFLGPAQALASHVPIVGGLLAGGIHMVASPLEGVVNEIQSQRDKNDVYRSIEGGGQINAFNERLGEETARLQTLGTLSGADASHAYQAITRLGFTPHAQVGGYTRQDMMAFVQDNKSDLGMSVDESINMLPQVTGDTTASLKDLSQALRDLTTDAKNAGVNTQMARQQMLTQAAAFQQGGFGGSAIDMANIVTGTNTSIGRSYSQSVDSTAMGSVGSQLMDASAAGESAADFGYDNFTKNTKAVTGAMDKLQGNLLDQFFPAAWQSWIKSYIAKNPKATDEEVATVFLTDYAKTDPDAKEALFNPAQVWAKSLGGLSGNDWKTNPTSLGAVEWGVNRLRGNTLASQAKRKGLLHGAESSKDLLKDTNKSPDGSDKAKNKTTSGLGTLNDMISSIGSPAGKVALNASPIPGAGLVGDVAGAVGAAGHAGASVATTIGNDASDAVGGAWGWLTGGGSGDKKPAPKKHPSAGAAPKTKVDVASSIKLDLTPDAKKLLSAIVVSGGDPYAAAAAASSGLPAPKVQTTRSA